MGPMTLKKGTVMWDVRTLDLDAIAAFRRVAPPLHQLFWNMPPQGSTVSFIVRFRRHGSLADTVIAFHSVKRWDHGLEFEGVVETPQHVGTANARALLVYDLRPSGQETKLAVQVTEV